MNMLLHSDDLVGMLNAWKTYNKAERTQGFDCSVTFSLFTVQGKSNTVQVQIMENND